MKALDVPALRGNFRKERFELGKSLGFFGDKIDPSEPGEIIDEGIKIASSSHG
jgi:hypothetical protein